MKFTTIIAIASALLVTSVDARFGQENAVNLASKISGPACLNDQALGRQFSGQEIALLLAGASPCAKLEMADDLIVRAKASCGADTDAIEQAIDAAVDLVAAERNFNPFAGNLDTVCTTPGLPAQAELKGILQKVDPRTNAPNNNDQTLSARAQALNARALQIQNAAKAAGTGPGASNALSMADLLFANGFDGIAAFTPRGGATRGDGSTGAGNNNNNNNNNRPTPPPPAVVAPPPPPPPQVQAGRGQCANVQQMQFISQPGGREHRFGRGGQQVALNSAIVIEQICNQAGACKADCEAAGRAMNGARGYSGQFNAAQSKTAAEAADRFNVALGKQSNIAAQFTGAAAGGQQGQGNNNNNQGQGNQNNNQGQGNNNGAAGTCTGPKMQFISRGNENRFGFNGNQVALNPGVVVGQLCTNLVKGDGCRAKCEAAGAALVASGARGFSTGADAAKAAQNIAAANQFNAAVGL